MLVSLLRRERESSTSRRIADESSRPVQVQLVPSSFHLPRGLCDSGEVMKWPFHSRAQRRTYRLRQKPIWIRNRRALEMAEGCEECIGVQLWKVAKEALTEESGTSGFNRSRTASRTPLGTS